MENLSLDELKLEAYRYQVLEYILEKIQNFSDDARPSPNVDEPTDDLRISNSISSLALEPPSPFVPTGNSTVIPTPVVVPSNPTVSTQPVRSKFPRMRQIVDIANQHFRSLNLPTIHLTRIQSPDQDEPFLGGAHGTEVCILVIARSDGSEDFVCSIKMKRKPGCTQRIRLFLQKDAYMADEIIYKTFFDQRYAMKWRAIWAEHAKHSNDADLYAAAYAIVMIGRDLPDDPVVFNLEKESQLKDEFLDLVCEKRLILDAFRQLFM